MSRAFFVLHNDIFRQRALDMVRSAPKEARVTVQDPKRTIPQNDRMWAMLTDVSQQKKWHGIWLSPEDWKLIFLDALNREVRIVPNIDGTGFVNLGRSSSALSISEAGDLMTIIEMFCANHGVELHDEGSDGAVGKRARSPRKTKT